MSRLKMDMKFNEAIFAMSEGNPGAIGVLMDAFRVGDEIDPEGMGAWGFLLNLDSFGIHGDRIWRLYKDLCGESVPKAMAMARSVQMGLIRAEELQKAIDGGKNLDPDEVAGRLREKLPSFKV